jgi:hypothetical protein
MPASATSAIGGIDVVAAALLSLTHNRCYFGCFLLLLLLLLRCGRR